MQGRHRFVRVSYAGENNGTARGRRRQAHFWDKLLHSARENALGHPARLSSDETGTGDQIHDGMLRMARRFSAPYQSEPVSSLASWARNLAVFSVVAVLVSILIVRFGFLEMKPAPGTFFGALACAGLSILVGLAAAGAIWQNGSRGMSRILVALLIDTAVLAYPAYLGVQYRKLPPIH